MTRRLLGLVLLLGAARVGQAPGGRLSDSGRTSRRPWALGRNLADAETKYLAAAPKQLDTVAARKLEPLAAERDLARTAATTLLDSVAYRTPWGASEVHALLIEYPESGLLV